MRVTSNFNKLYHACFLKDLFDQMTHAHSLYMSFDSFKQALKYANKEYPRYDGTTDLVSTKDIRSGDLVSHLEWIRRYAGNYGFTIAIDDEEFKRMCELAHA